MKPIIILLLSLLPFGAFAGEPAPASAAGEPTVAELSAQLEALKARTSTWDKIAARLPRISGYVQTGYEWSETSSTFFIKRVRLNLAGDIAEKLDYRVQIEFCGPKIVDAYIRYRPFEQLNFQLGEYKLPFSIENTDYVPLKYEFIEYPLSLRRLMGFNDVCGLSATGRDMGAMLYGGFFNRKGYSVLGYNFGVFNGEGLNVKDKNKSKDLVARLTLRPVRGLQIAGSYYWGEYGSDYLKRVRYGAGACYDEGPLVVRAEWICGTTGLPGRRTRQRRLVRRRRVARDAVADVRGALRYVPRKLLGERLAPDQLHGGRRVAAREIPALPAQLHLRRLCVPRRRQPQCGVADALRNFLIELP